MLIHVYIYIYIYREREREIEFFGLSGQYVSKKTGEDLAETTA